MASQALSGDGALDVNVLPQKPPVDKLIKKPNHYKWEPFSPMKRLSKGSSKRAVCGGLMKSVDCR